MSIDSHHWLNSLFKHLLSIFSKSSRKKNYDRIFKSIFRCYVICFAFFYEFPQSEKYVLCFEGFLNITNQTHPPRVRNLLHTILYTYFRISSRILKAFYEILNHFFFLKLTFFVRESCSDQFNKEEVRNSKYLYPKLQSVEY